MGKFDGVLLMSDYDDTLYNHKWTVSRENLDAIRYFMAEGGRFSVATGRAHRTFTPQIAKEGLVFNAPVVLSNGAAIFDYENDRYLALTRLPDGTAERLAELCVLFPELGFEAYYGEDIYVHNPNEVTRQHLKRVAVPYTVCPIGEMKTPWVKAILQQDYPYLCQVRQYILDHWPREYEVIFSNRYLLELTALGSNKGGMVARVAQHLNIDPARIYCIGDNQNDIPMLALSAIPFAPQNCSQPVKDWGARLVSHCDDHAVAHVIRILDELY